MTPPTKGMNIQTQDPQTLKVTGVAELAAPDASQARDAIVSALQPDHTTLLLDLSSATFLDSSGLGALISLHKRMRARNGVLRLLNPAPAVMQILELTRLHRVFDIAAP
jgi:anti-sigma B factor antagonist